MAVEGDTIDGYCGFCGEEGHASKDCTALSNLARVQAQALPLMEGSHDQGALHAIEMLRAMRRRYPVRSFLTRGRYELDLLEKVVLNSAAEGYHRP